MYAGICILALAGCSMNSYATTASTVTEGSQEQPPKDMGVMGKITAVDDNVITVVLADAPSMNGNASGETSADGTTPPEKPADGTTPPEKPADGTAQTMPEMNFNGETKTYTIPSSAAITKGMEQESAFISDLTVDSVLRIALDGDTVTGVNIMN